MKNIKDKIKSLMVKISENYNYFKAGRKAEFLEQQKRIAERNKKAMENIRKGQADDNLKLKGWK